MTVIDMHAIPQKPLVRLEQITKNYGAVRALAGVTLTLSPAECVGLAGHNGAGKSTMMQILAGNVRPDGGELLISGEREIERYDVQRAFALGIRCVFQELSLCPNLTVLENTRVRHPSIRGIGWRGRAASLILKVLDDIFPNNTIRPNDLVADLTLGQRQMVEIAIVFANVGSPLRLVILDEPTSSLDQAVAAQLLSYVRRFVGQGGCVVLISHILGEVLSTCDRIAVMGDGRVIEVRPAGQFTKHSLVEAMGHINHERPQEHVESPAKERTSPIVAQIQPPKLGSLKLEVRRGEIIGLGGLAGQGQTPLLVLLQRAYGRNLAFAKCECPPAFVAGDRQTDGVFPLWSIGQNITIRSLSKMRRFGLIDPRQERAMERHWKDRIAIRTPDIDDNIYTLSGGNQQKALFARALASDAEIILMDDPMRGVDIGTKQEVYDIIRSEAAKGRTFIWYTTEFEELTSCDYVYVLRSGAIVAEMHRSEISEAKVLKSSFAEVTA